MINLKDFITEPILFSKTFNTHDKKEITLYITSSKIYTIERKIQENKLLNYIFNRNVISTVMCFESSTLGDHYVVQFNVDGKAHSFEFPYTPEGEVACDEVFAALVKY